MATDSKNNRDSRLSCGICEVSFTTKEEKEQHLRLHCILCKVLFESRDALLDHMTESHHVEASGAVFWPLQSQVASSDEEDADALSADERDLIEYQREHLDQ